MTKKFTVFVNTSDGFEDCWNPFFKLFSKYWKGGYPPILLNTEHKEFNYSGLVINSSQVNKNVDRRLTWSECFISALNQVETPLVLYFQEDYFIEKEVKAEVVNDFAQLMIANPEIKYIGLTHMGNRPPFYPYPNDKRLAEVSNKSKYRISTQVGLWQKDTLISYLRENENGWMFEIFGTKRSQKRKELFLTVNREIYNKENPIIDYQLTGIIKGKWLSTIPELFKKEGIDMDFSKRGFYKTPLPLFRKIETFRKLLKSPFILYNGLRGS
jgi:hypothetical protein